MKHSYLLLSFLLLTLLPTRAAQRLHAVVYAPTDEKEVTESIRRYFRSYTTPGYKPYTPNGTDSIRIEAAAESIHIYANESFSSQLLSPSDIEEIYTELRRLLPAPYSRYELTIHAYKGGTIEDLVPNLWREHDADKSRLWQKNISQGQPWVKNLSRPSAAPQGLEGSHLMIAPSHGRYFKFGKWQWQRPRLFCTTEDLFTQSFVFPLLIPMLENAGAVVCSPRERDPQTIELVLDNDRATDMGSYEEQTEASTRWKTVTEPAGFALPAGNLTDSLQPFQAGTARCVASTQGNRATARAVWTPRFPTAGRYAVYVSYVSLPRSTDAAHYTVVHRGIHTDFHVNQQIGGGTWVYLGTFDFEAGQSGRNCLLLDNTGEKQTVVSADAVRFGGGIGRTERAEAGTSGLPRGLEGARYHAQWSGLPDSLYCTEDGTNDYNDDIRARSHLLNYLSGGSPYVPDTTGLGVPFEASVALHSDAGVRRDRTVYGSMAICTTRDADGSEYYRSGMSRYAASDLSRLLLNGLSRDLSAATSGIWTHREAWNRNYGETRTPCVPAAIVEMLSHQNYRDMVYGHDPLFKFHLARSVYKSLLRFVSGQHQRKTIVVQPLPVEQVSVLFTGKKGEVRLSWKARTDSLEPTARPDRYILYTKTDDNDFDNGQVVHSDYVLLTLEPDKRYAFRIAAANNGGCSLPSETVVARYASGEAARILIVNAFDRLSGPARIETADSLGFDLEADLGVPYLYTNAFVGYQQNFSPEAAGREGTDGLGYSDEELMGKVIAGNTFDYSDTHGRAIAAAGPYSYCTVSHKALALVRPQRAVYAATDWIAGLQRDVTYNSLPCKTFDEASRRWLEQYVESGGALLVSGAYLGTDMQQPDEQHFLHTTLHCRLQGQHLSHANDSLRGLNLSLPLVRAYNSRHYAAPRCDVLEPVGPAAFTAFRYADDRSAGIACSQGSRHTIVCGFPWECLEGEDIRCQSMKALLRFLLP